MGSDLAMNPPRPDQWVLLTTPRLGAIALYRYQPDRIYRHASDEWVRVYFINTSFSMETREQVFEALQGRATRHVEVDTDAKLMKNITNEEMREIISPTPPVYRPKHA